MQSARRPSCFSANPLFSRPIKFSRWIDSRTSFKAAAMSRPGGWKRASLVVIENSTRAPHSNVEHHGAGRIGFGSRRESPAATITVTVAVGSSCARLVNASAFSPFEHGLVRFSAARAPCVASEPWRDYQPPTQVWPDRGENGCRSSDAARQETPPRSPRPDERVLLVRDPEANRLVQAMWPTPWPGRSSCSTSSAVAEIRGLANHTLLAASSRTT